MRVTKPFGLAGHPVLQQTTLSMANCPSMKRILYAVLLSLPAFAKAAGGYPVPVQDRIPIGNGRCEQTVKVSNRQGAAYGSFDLPNPECGPFSGGDIWLVADAPVSGQLVVSGDYSDFSLTRMAFYALREGELVLLACAFPEQLHQVPETRLTDLRPGEPVFVRVWDAGNDETGEATICAYDPIRQRRSAVKVTPAQQRNAPVSYPAYPNPANEYITLDLRGESPATSVVIMDLAGRILVRENTAGQEQLTVDLRDLSSGLYTLLVQNQYSVRSELIRIER